MARKYMFVGLMPLAAASVTGGARPTQSRLPKFPIWYISYEKAAWARNSVAHFWFLVDVRDGFQNTQNASLSLTIVALYRWQLFPPLFAFVHHAG